MATAPSSGDAPVATEPGAPSDADRSGWSPLRFTAFRRWWLANLTSNIGSWMQTIAAQWVMTTLTTSAFLVGAIQATNLRAPPPGPPGGAWGAFLNPKSQPFPAHGPARVPAPAGRADLAGLVTPAVLLTLLCGVGVGQGLTGPIAQTLQPELVPRPNGRRRSRSGR